MRTQNNLFRKSNKVFKLKTRNVGMDDEILLADIYKKLLKKAEEDGVITPDEKAILFKVKMEGTAYDENLRLAYNDQIISEKEREKLTYLRSNLYKASERQAKKDNVITNDEKELLTLLMKLLKEQGPVNT